MGRYLARVILLIRGGGVLRYLARGGYSGNGAVSGSWGR